MVDQPTPAAESLKARHAMKVARQIQKLTGLPISYSPRHKALVVDPDVAAGWLRERGLDG